MPLFSRTLGLAEPKAFLTKALQSQKFPHALLIHGLEGVGQNALLLDLADILLCEKVMEELEIAPCGQCKSCLGRIHENLDNITFLIPLEKKGKADSKMESKADSDGGMEDDLVDELANRIKEFRQDVYGFLPSPKSRINIAQTRALQAHLSFSEVNNRPRIIIIPFIETMPHEAANALLKTLEEPPANTYFLISSQDRAGLLPTILSRCTKLPIPPMTSIELTQALAEKGKDFGLENLSPRLIPFAEGSLGALISLNRNGGEALLNEAGAFFHAAFSQSNSQSHSQNKARGQDQSNIQGKDSAQSVSTDWRRFSDYLEGSDFFVDMDSTSRLIPLLLRMVRLCHRMKVYDQKKIDESLNAEDEKTLSALIQPLFLIDDLQALVQWLEEILSAVQSYAKPRIAVLGLYLDYEAKNFLQKANA